LVDLSLSSVSNATGNFLTISGNVVHQRTAAQTLTDIGGQAALTNPVTGTGTTNFLPKFTGATTLGNSVISDTATEINIPKRIFLNSGGENILFTPNLSGTVNRIEGSSGIPLQIVTAGSSLAFAAGGSTTQATLFSSGNFVINSAVDNGAKFQVTGTATISSTLTANGTIIAGLQGGNIQLKGATDGFVGVNGSGSLFLTDWTTATKGLQINLSTGAATFSSNVTATGITSTASVSAPHVTKSANYTLDATDYTVGFDCASNRTATLPDATTCQGRIYVIYQYNTGSGARSVTLDGNGSQTINGVTTYSLSPFCEYTSVMIQSNGANWIIISSNFTTDCL
jgi:hypothetical protein